MSTGTPPAPQPGPLLDRALAADQRARAACPRSYARRHTEWPVWTRRQHLATTLAATLGVPIDTVAVGDDPDRGYGINAHYPGDLLTLTDPHTGQVWRFVPDFTGAQSWLLLGACPRCPAAAAPVAQIAALADLGAWRRTQPATHLPAELAGDRAHHPSCPYAGTDLPTPRGPAGDSG